jgi:BirA family biotin operon repressor/biotin-[acetyl-CoA-carboxylase] ligase
LTGTPAGGPFLSRVERYPSAGSTNDIVRTWLLDATPEVCCAVADEQTAGRGRHGRTWTAPAGAALLCSLGFRPTYLPADRAWRVAATVALAMCDAAEDAAGLPEGALRLKWPNDLVVEFAGPGALLTGLLAVDEAAARLAAPLRLQKIAGVLGESDGLGTDSPRVVVGIGVNADWARDDFPPDIADTMTSLREASGGRPVDQDILLEAFLDRLEGRVAALRAGWFDADTWVRRQATTGREVTLEAPDGTATAPLLALAVDAASGALVVSDDDAPGGERHVHAGEVLRVRLAGTATQDGV